MTNYNYYHSSTNMASHSMNQTIAKLKGLQKMFLLPISRGYNIISTDASMVLVGVPPIHLMVQYEYQRAHCTVGQIKNETPLFIPM